MKTRPNIDNKKADFMTVTYATHLSLRKQIIARHFACAREYDQHATVQQQICQHLLTQIRSPHHHSVLEVGAGRGQLTRQLATHIQSPHWSINELSHTQVPHLQAILPTATILTGDAETQDLGAQHSLIVSASAVQWFDDPIRFVQQSATRLQAGGQLLFNTFTPDNFLQIKALTGQGLYYPPIKAWRDALDQAGLNTLEVSTQRFEVAFATPFLVLKHMQRTGVSTNKTQPAQHAKSAQAPTPFRWSKARLAQFEREYWQHFSGTDQGAPCVYLTYEALIINAIKP